MQRAQRVGGSKREKGLKERGAWCHKISQHPVMSKTKEPDKTKLTGLHRQHSVSFGSVRWRGTGSRAAAHVCVILGHK